MQKEIFKFEKRVNEGSVEEAEFLTKFLSSSNM